MAVPEEITKLVGESGNNFHAKVARWFQSEGWHVTISPYYMDQSLNKAREIDLVAEKILCPIPDAFGRPFDHVAVRLFVECKFIPSYSVFWFADKDRTAAEKLVCSHPPFTERNLYTNKHHYLAECPRVAKLFAASATRGPENDPYYKALNQVLHASFSMSSGRVSIPECVKRDRMPQVVLEYPVVVCSSFMQVYGVDFFSDSEPTPIGENFQLELQYAFIDRTRHRTEHVLIDFVEFQQLGRFANALAEDAKAASALADR